MIQAAKLLTDSRYREHTAFWKEALSRLDGDFHSRQNWRSYALSSEKEIEIAFEIDAPTAGLITKLAAGKDIGVFVILVGAVCHALKLYSGSSTVCVESPPLGGAGRNNLDSNVPLVAHFQAGLSVKEHLDAIRRMAAGSYTYQDFPVSAVRDLLLKRGRTQTSNVLVTCPAIHEEARGAASYDLMIEIEMRPRLRLVLRGGAAEFARSYLENFGRHLCNILREYADTEKPVGQVSALDQAERERLLREYNPARNTIPKSYSIDRLFYARAAEAPDRLAIKKGDQKTTYGELNAASNRLARFLQDQLGIGQGDAVGLFFDRSPESIIGLLAVLKAGAVYLPLDPEYPSDRIRFMVEDARAKAFLIHSDHISQLMQFSDVPMFALDIQMSTLQTPAEDLEPSASASDAAYIIYTSGSTGKPKGVVLEHGGLANTVLHHIEALNVESTDRLSQFYSASFDSSLFEIFVALLSGAALVLVSKEFIKDPEQFGVYIESQGVTMLTVPPVYLSTLNRARLGGVKKIVSAGDNARLGEAVELARTKAYYNSYGPTETSICVTHYQVNPSVHYGSRIPIGKPISNTSIYVLDEDLRLVPEGCIGEICVSGVAVARGYLNEATTKTSFVKDPFIPGERMYRTGDLGVWLPDGNLELVGRNDTQVKIRGYRVELGEVESALLRHSSVKQAVAVAREDSGGGKRLVTYITADRPVTAAELRAHLKERLPRYMIPSAFVTLAEMPVTANGKIDRKALPDPQTMEEIGGNGASRNDTEQKLVEIWKETLGIERVGIRDNFFELGGDSILIIQMVSQAARQGIKLTPQDVFERQTIASLAEVAGTVEIAAAEQGVISGPVRLLPMQAWFFQQEIEARHHYNQSVMLDVPADLNPELLRECLKGLLTHHAALRARFVLKDDEWEQEIAADERSDVFSAADLSNIAPDRRESTLEQEASSLQASIDLANGPLMRVRLFRMDETRARLLLVAHHLVIDGVSWRILLEDLYAAYQQRSAGQAIQLPAKTTSIREWAERLNQYAQSLKGEYHYWLKQTSGSPLPLDYDGGANTMDSAEEITVLLDQSETDSLLHDAPRAYNTQINDLLLTALALMYKEWTGEEALLVDLEAHGREDLFGGVDLSRTVGWLTAIYPVLLEAGTDDVASNLKAIKGQLRSVPHNGIGYGILRYLRTSRPSGGDSEQRVTLKAQPQASIVFNYLGQTDRVLSVEGDWRAIVGSNGGERGNSGRRSYQLEITGIVTRGRLQLTFTYSRNLHRKETIELRAGRFLEKLRGLISHCCGLETRSFSPSDFPAARIDQKALDTLISQINQE